MIRCEECDKKLGIMEGYRHPALGTSFLVCRNFFDKVDKIMEQWMAFCLSDLFNPESSKIDIQDAWYTSISNDMPLQKWFSALWLKQSIRRRR